MLLSEGIALPRAKGVIQHLRPKLDAQGVLIPIRIGDDGAPIIDDNVEVVGEEVVYNVITNAGRDYLHSQGYNTSGGAANGFCYIGLSNDTLTETTASTTLSTEITTNGLARAVGVYAHTTGTNTTTITNTFTCATAPQAAQKAALFTASSAGTMNHALSFTQRSLQIADTLAVTFTITLG